MAVQQSRLVQEKLRYFDFNWFPWQCPLRDCKKLNEMNKPLHPCTNPEILVKIGPLDSELPGQESQPLKNKKENIKKKHRQNMYTMASLSSRLKNLVMDFHKI